MDYSYIQPVTLSVATPITTTVKPWGRLISCHQPSSSVDLVADESYIGRNPKRCHVLFMDPTISGVHCKIFIANRDIDQQQQSDILRSRNTIWITDYSTNGTFVNGLLLGKNKTTNLENGDQISLSPIGISTLSFVFQNLLLSDQDPNALVTTFNKVVAIS